MILLIYGAGGLAKEVYDLVMRTTPNKYEKIFFIDDFRDEGPFYFSETIKFTSIKACLGERINEVEGIVAVGEPRNRKVLAEKFANYGIRMTTIIDKTAIVSPTAKVGEGTIICEMSTIHADVRIGLGVLIQPFVVIGHDIRIGNYSVLGTHCSPGGGTTIGECVYAGMNSSIKEDVIIGDCAVLGMGASLFRNIDTNVTVVGNPARETKGNDQHKVFLK